MDRTIELPNNKIPSTAAWNLHANSQLVIAGTEDLFVYDTRQSMNSCVFRIEFADELYIRDVQCNPNRAHRWMTAGDDGHLRCWDLRGEPKKLMEIENAHSHWIWNVRYNPIYDQLCLSCSSDMKVKLWNWVSLSSAESIHFTSVPHHHPNEIGNSIPDGLVHTYEQHEESIYSVAWSRTDPWTFASLSYDGRMVIEHIPEDIKYKILL